VKDGNQKKSKKVKLKEEERCGEWSNLLGKREAKGRGRGGQQAEKCRFS